MAERSNPKFFLGLGLSDGGKTAKLMSFSAKRCAYLPETELLKPVRNLLHRAPVACASGCRHVEFIPPVARLKGAFWPRLTFLPSLPAIADEVFE